MASTNIDQGDLTLISELWQSIGTNPPDIEARVLLMHCYDRIGWNEDANAMAMEILRHEPGNVDADQFVQRPRPSASTEGASGTRLPRNRSDNGPRSTEPPPRNDGERVALEAKFYQAYTTLTADAKQLLRESRFVRDLQQHQRIWVSEEHNKLQESRTEDLQLLSQGRIWSVVSTSRPQSALTLARTVASEAREDRVLDMIVDDLNGIIRWMQQSEDDTPRSNDQFREAINKRVRILTAALPANLKHWPPLAFIHVEHEQLHRSYANSETMYGDAIADIPRANFWVSQDGYAWDMDELATAITVGGGVMRNPLNGQIFPPEDVKSILQHPMGRRLAPLQVEQRVLRQGIRPATLDRLADLARVMMADQSMDQAPSRRALDEFFAYVATLPDSEQKAIDALRVPAVDSHTGQAFDGTIGESLRDAKANRTCLHKTADFIGQAARHLRDG